MIFFKKNMLIKKNKKSDVKKERRKGDTKES